MYEEKNKRHLGAKYEEIAALHIQQQGLTIRDKNYRCRQGEIDLIAQDGICLIFIEVKYRKNSRMGLPAQAVDRRKQQKIRKVAEYYLYERGYGDRIPCRFDVIGILGNEISWIQNAF